MKVVGTMFFENEKLLIDKPRKRPTYQMIGGKVEEGETTLQAAIRECHEELGDEAIFDEEKFELIKIIEIQDINYRDAQQIFKGNDLLQAIKEFNINVNGITKNNAIGIVHMAKIINIPANYYE